MKNFLKKLHNLVFNKITPPAPKKEVNIYVEELYYLEVPFAQKDIAKKLGAMWDPDKKNGIYLRIWTLSLSRDGFRAGVVKKI